MEWEWRYDCSDMRLPLLGITRHHRDAYENPNCATLIEQIQKASGTAISL
jgi:hypothetical protein